MSIADALLPEFDQEMANTRKMIEAIPDEKLTFKVHEKNWDMASLATHLATLPSWGADTMNTESLDFTGYKPPESAKSRQELLDQFDKGVSSARTALSSATDQSFHQNWSLSANGQTFFTLPRIAVIRSFVMNHLIHHRAQLGMYLRMAGAKVPGMYGPSADEPMMPS